MQCIPAAYLLFRRYSVRNNGRLIDLAGDLCLNCPQRNEIFHILPAWFNGHFSTAGVLLYFDVINSIQSELVREKRFIPSSLNFI
jgi:hypothetical protein